MAKSNKVKIKETIMETVLATESITLFTATGLHTFDNLIDVNTLDCDDYDKQLVKAQWWDHLNIVCGLDDNAVESFITEHGYLIPQDWLERHAALNLMK